MAPLLELEHVIDALQGFKRPLREGREAIGNLVVVGIRSRSKAEVTVEAHCVRTTKINENPVEIVVHIDLQTSRVEEKIKSISCSCPAGSSKEHCCKHGMATLLYLERNDEGKLEKLTCTDVTQKWGAIQESTRTVLTKFEPIPLKDFCHISSQQPPYKRPVREVTKELESEFRSMFLADQPESEAAVFESCVRHSVSRDHDEEEVSIPLITTIVSHALTNTSFILLRAAELGKELYMKCTLAEKNYYDTHVKITDQDAMNICVETVEQSESDEWEKKRFGKITGSICYSYFTYYKNKTPNWLNKITTTFKSSSADEKVTTKAMEDGLLYEGDARDCYEKKLNNKNMKVAHPGFFNHPITPWLGFSADGVTCENGLLVRLWENKTPKCGNQHGAESIYKHVNYMSKDGKLKEKHPYYGQCQLGMLLLALPICDFTLYSIKHDQVYIDSVTFNEKFCLELSERLTHVYFEQILPWLASCV
ncbi:Poly(ADP-ribose) glycohydrolase 1 [Frankliniella fusca]|uniref:Poly(ADP-ribose) glycohydrolase 1 n=1 Tax=Frankliniella fusca TaxID=407009 RepID=A0AAE1HUF2_9NEOP|nr:Poly(ADP-ribose) glycohydrolase 1 [Frankliniella fusca]